MIWSLPGPAQVAEVATLLEPTVRPDTIILDTTTGDPTEVDGTLQALPIAACRISIARSAARADRSPPDRQW